MIVFDNGISENNYICFFSAVQYEKYHRFSQRTQEEARGRDPVFRYRTNDHSAVISVSSCRFLWEELLYNTPYYAWIRLNIDFTAFLCYNKTVLLSALRFGENYDVLYLRQ